MGNEGKTIPEQTDLEMEGTESYSCAICRSGESRLKESKQQRQFKEALLQHLPQTSMLKGKSRQIIHKNVWSLRSISSSK